MTAKIEKSLTAYLSIYRSVENRLPSIDKIDRRENESCLCHKSKGKRCRSLVEIVKTYRSLNTALQTRPPISFVYELKMEIINGKPSNGDQMTPTV